jgi:NAD(P)H-hydrate epimerase
MKILTGKQIRDADRATIASEGISSLDLMERAANGIARWIANNVEASHPLLFCCGKGGNGGDGLAAARILSGWGRDCSVLLGVGSATAGAALAAAAAADAASAAAGANTAGTVSIFAPKELTDDTRANLARLPRDVKVYDIIVERPDIESNTVIIDALLGVGVTGEVREPYKGIIEWMNALPNPVISIDIPSGMPTEWGSAATMVNAGTILTIGFPKLAMLLPETGGKFSTVKPIFGALTSGNLVVIPIGLDEKFLAATDTSYYYITEELVESLCQPRVKFTHKGDYGHALLVCGSAAMPGAAILAVGGAVRSGCGLVTVHIPENERHALIANHPSAMLSLDKGECFTTPPEALKRFSAIGVGPGLGRDRKTATALEKLMTEAADIPMILDADALNIIAAKPDLQKLIPLGSVLTPHPGELRRLIGEWSTDREKLEKASKLSRETRCVIVVKGAHSVVCTPDGRFLFNSTGTPGMAKGGSGDVLTGLITGLMARGYDAENASITAVYTHGRAGERAAGKRGVEAMNASDLADFL